MSLRVVLLLEINMKSNLYLLTLQCILYITFEHLVEMNLLHILTWVNFCHLLIHPSKHQLFISYMCFYQNILFLIYLLW